jgi:hypothetical protein
MEELKGSVVVQTTNIDLNEFIRSKKFEIEMIDNEIALATKRRNDIIASLEGLALVKDRLKELVDAIAILKPVQPVIKEIVK